MSVFVIAEAGVNHNGDLARALAMVDAAADAGADAVKFQIFRAEAVASTRAPKALYQRRTTEGLENQLDMIRKLELPYSAFPQLAHRCRLKNVGFLCSPFDIGSLNFLIDEIDTSTIKIASGELTNAPLLLAAARAKRSIILSTGMGTMAEIEEALGVIVFGIVGAAERPGRTAFAAAYADPSCRQSLTGKVTLLHCTTAYPAPAMDVNLRAMATMADAFGLPVGYSDHTEGTTVTIAAVACGAVMIEKHFTLDRELPGPDHKASLEPDEFRTMVDAIRETKAALGDGVKRLTPSEIENLTVVRRSLTAGLPIAKGTKFTVDNLAVLRPGNGFSPLEYWTWLGRAAERDLAEGEQL